jgi:hypothetical protein
MRQTIQNPVLSAWQTFQEHAAAVLPHVMTSLIVLVLGVLLGMIAGRVANRLLKTSGLDQHAARFGLAGSLEAIGISSTVGLLARILQWFIIFSSSILALYSLDARLASDLAERFLLYLPHLVGSILILGAGVVLARFLSRSVLIAAVNHDVRPARLLGGLTRVGVMVLAVAIALEHAGIGRTTVPIAFAILFGGATLAASIALGLGMQDLVRRWLSEQFDESGPKREEEKIHHW